MRLFSKVVSATSGFVCSYHHKHINLGWKKAFASNNTVYTTHMSMSLEHLINPSKDLILILSFRLIS